MVISAAGTGLAHARAVLVADTTADAAAISEIAALVSLAALATITGEAFVRPKHPANTPPERTITVPAPLRVFVAPPRARTATVPASQRILEVTALSITRIHDPQATLDYAFDWGARRLLPDEQIETATVTTDDPAMAVTDTRIDGRRVIAWLSGGTLGGRAAVTCRVTTSQGRTDDSTVRLLIRNR